MVKSSTRLRFRRRVRTTRKNVEQAQSQAAEHLDKHIVRRWQKFADVRRFVFGWLALMGLLLFGMYAQIQSLSGYYKETVRAPGGIYSEGVVGEITNLNPIFASSPPDRTVSALLFSPLVHYSQGNEVVGALAQSWTVSADQKSYTFEIKENAFWHDGRPVVSADIVFTFNAIQHPDTASPLNRSWRNITVEAKDDRTVIFTLPNPFTPFIHSLTKVGILPFHILGEVRPNELRAHSFNLAPRIGTGPFTFNNITLEEDSGQVRLTRFDRYYLGSPLLDEVVIKSYQDHESMINAFNEGTITGIAGLRIQDLESLKPKSDFTLHAPSLFNNIGIFFNNNQDPLKNVKMRQALTYATDNSQVASMLGYKYPSSSSPLLRSQLGYSDKYQQLSYDKTKAQKLLDELGWKVGPDGIRIKDGAALEMQLLAQNSDEYPAVAEEIQRQWHEVGIVLKLEFVSPTDLQQNHVVPHNYQLLLIGINQGVDPDVFAYWHSSEAGIGGFNLSEYKNSVADLALESGRTRQDPKLRTAKYETFLQQWRKDAPAVMLYRPSYFYAQLEVVTGFENKHIDDPVDRFSDIAFWTINTKEVNKSY